jgi:hypothetical protein
MHRNTWTRWTRGSFGAGPGRGRKFDQGSSRKSLGRSGGMGKCLAGGAGARDRMNSKRTQRTNGKTTFGARKEQVRIILDSHICPVYHGNQCIERCMNFAGMKRRTNSACPVLLHSTLRTCFGPRRRACEPVSDAAMNGLPNGRAQAERPGSRTDILRPADSKTGDEGLDSPHHTHSCNSVRRTGCGGVITSFSPLVPSASPAGTGAPPAPLISGASPRLPYSRFPR